AHAPGNGLAGTKVRNLIALDEHLAAGGRVQPIEDVHQRGFARAVFPHQGKDLPLADVQRHVMIRQHTGELHGYVLEGTDGLALCQINRLAFAFQKKTEGKGRRPRLCEAASPHGCLCVCYSSVVGTSISPLMIFSFSASTSAFSSSETCWGMVSSPYTTSM